MKNIFGDIKKCIRLDNGNRSALERIIIGLVVLLLLAMQIILIFFEKTAAFTSVVGFFNLVLVIQASMEVCKNKLTASLPISETLHRIYLPSVFSVMVIIDLIIGLVISAVNDRYSTGAVICFAVFHVIGTVQFISYCANTNTVISGITGGIVGGSLVPIMELAEEESVYIPMNSRFILLAASAAVCIAAAYIFMNILYSRDRISRISSYERFLKAKGKTI